MINIDQSVPYFRPAALKFASDHGRSELKRIAFLDGWRGLAIGLVLIDHFLPVSGIALGRMGVDVFFVLSGMLMANILFVKRVPLSIFYKRRISRILPVFVVFVSLVYGSSLLLGLSEEHDNYLFTILFLRSYLPVMPNIWDTGIPVDHLWSLNVEEHCYLLLSLLTLIAAFKSKEYIPLLLLGTGSILLHGIYIKFPSFAAENFHLKTETLASHLLISAGYFLIKDRFRRVIRAWMPLLAFALALACYHEQAPWFAKWLFTPFLLAFTVNHLDVLPSIFMSALKFMPLRLLGMWSFSIYLWQQPFYFYGVKYGEAFNFAGPILLSVSLFIGAISFYFFENPVRKYINNNW
jgi:peptidoglycan/LPS O-acetylase OafA/YrhL